MNSHKSSDYIEITHDQLVRYAGASGDFNPIHTDRDAAEERGLPTVIAHGMYIMGLAATELTKWYGLHRIQSFSVRFAAMTVPGEQVKIVSEVKDDGTSGEVHVVNEAGETKLKGTFELLA